MSYSHTFSSFTNFGVTALLGDSVAPNLGGGQGDIEDVSDATMIAHESGHGAEDYLGTELSMKVADAGLPEMNARITAVAIRLRHNVTQGDDSGLLGFIYRSGEDERANYSNPGASMTTEDASFSTAPDGTSPWTRALLFETTFGFRIGGGIAGDRNHNVAKMQVLVDYESPAGMHLVAIL